MIQLDYPSLAIGIGIGITGVFLFLIGKMLLNRNTPGKLIAKEIEASHKNLVQVHKTLNSMYDYFKQLEIKEVKQ